jgi:hypothetical protein
MVQVFHCVLPKCPSSTGPCPEIYGVVSHFVAVLMQGLPVPSLVVALYHLWKTHILGILSPRHRKMTYGHLPSSLRLTT